MFGVHYHFVFHHGATVFLYHTCLEYIITLSFIMVLLFFYITHVWSTLSLCLSSWCYCFSISHMFGVHYHFVFQHGAAVFLYHPCLEYIQIEALRVIARSEIPKKHIITPYNLPKNMVSILNNFILFSMQLVIMCTNQLE